MSISDWPPDDRPREKLLAKGASALSDAELLAIFLRTGIKGASAVDLSRRLLDHFGSFGALLAADKDKFCALRGVGPAKFVQFQAVMEMARRTLLAETKAGVNLSSPQAVRDFLRLQLQGRAVEVFVGIFLDAQNRVIEAEELFSGTLTQTSVFPREVVRRALHFNAAGMIFAHNHPSGVAEPSHADENLTQVLKQALALVDVRVLDHFIVGRGTTLSFAERGLL
ncbi:MAG TPA: DNA repair protein RadC [Burkholderiales bacterium]|nr:DNA repair protein RadC [Burkholderiales bacterium]